MTWLTDGGWYHVDQNALRPGRQGKVCVQGLVTLCDADETTGGLVVVPGSHKHHDAMCARSKIAKSVGDFLPVPADDPVMIGGDSPGPCLVCARAGDLIVWDSRTVHCNTPSLVALGRVTEAEAAEPAAEAAAAVAGNGGGKGSSGETKEGSGDESAGETKGERVGDNNGDGDTNDDGNGNGGAAVDATGAADGSPWALIRQVGYVCMTPATMATEATLEQRRMAFVDNISTSHWPHAFVMAGAALPGTPKGDPDNISKDQRALIGYDRPTKGRCALL